MIAVNRLVSSLRYALKDAQAVNVSDFELVEAINNATWLLYTKIAEQYVLAGVKKKILVVDESGEAGLPTDFYKIHQVGMADEGRARPGTYQRNCEGEYRILGEAFYAPEGVYGLEYYYIPPRVGSTSDSLDVPIGLASYLIEIALALFTNELEKAEQIIQICVNTLAARELSHFEDIGPVEILGGRL